MRTHPDIAALRGNPALQHSAQARLEAALVQWRAQCGLVELEHELASFADGAAPGENLSALFGSNAAPATAMVGGLVREVSAALTEQPLGHLSLRHALDDLAATLVLARSGPAAISLQVLDGAVLARRPLAMTAVYQPLQSVARVLRGRGTARLVTDHGARNPPSVSQLAVQSGQVLRCDGHRETLLIDRIEGCLVMLKLQRRSPHPAPAREIDLASGTALRQAAGSPRDSRLELATALLGRMGRVDAASLLAEMVLEPGSPQLRWHALRECLALDSGAGFAALSGVAGDNADPLHAPASALRAQLLATHPGLEAQPCPA